MSDALLRRIRVLELLTKTRRTSVSELIERLKNDRFQVERRALERDLNKLAERFPIAGDGSKPQGWSWLPDSELIQLPKMTAAQALTYQLLGTYLSDLMPHSLREHLRPQLQMAESTLSEGASRLHDWSRRVAMVRMGPDRLAPEVDATVVEAVYQALLDNLQLAVAYRSATADQAKPFVLHPQALVVMDEVVYLVASYGGEQGPYQFALQRMASASVLGDPATPLPGFDLDDYVRNQRGFQYSDGRQIKLVLDVGRFLRRQLEERPLAANQQVTGLDDSGNRHRVTVRLEMTEQLRWWLRSWGRELEVVKPLALRREFAAEFTELAARYADDDMAAK